MTGRFSFLGRSWLWVAVVLTVAKLWLTRGQGVFAIGNAAYDDRLFPELAQHLLRGEWLGPYNELTLAKGPFYPLFIAAAFTLGLPLFFAQQLFYAAACAIFVRALRPAIISGGARTAIYALLLCNPMSFDGSSMGRVLRQHVYGPLGLMIFAGLIALYLRRTDSLRRQAPWIILLGLAGAAFYLTREETVWLAPSVLLLAGAALFGARRTSAATARRTGASLGLALALAVVPVLLVCAENRKHYGWFGTCEIRAGDFADAYGAMLRVRVGPEIPFVPVSREARGAIAAVSPAFAALQQQFDAGIARNWAGPSESVTGRPAAEEQIGGGWLIWAVREATAQAGHSGNARQALSFYRKLAQEINQACDEGRLPAGPWRSGFVPPWRQEAAGPFLHALVEFSDFTAGFKRFSARAPASVGSPEELQFFRDLTRERLSPPEGELDTVGAAQYVLNQHKVDALQQAGKAVRLALPWFFWLAQITALCRGGWLLWMRRWTFPLVVAAAAWGACAASLVMHAMIEATSYPVMTISSFAPIYPLLLVFITAVGWDVFAAWHSPRAASEAPAAAALDPDPAPADDEAGSRLWILLAGLAALAPFLIWQTEFRKLFWFADDLFLLDEMAAMGMREWCGHVFSENFVPLFKLLWGGCALLFGGSYLAMLWLLWLTHALNTWVFGRLLQRAGFARFAVLAAQLLFAFTPANLETLGWSVQWSAVLATGFLLQALWWHEEHQASAAALSWRLHLPLFLLSAASACSFSRGVLTGGVLALALLLPAVTTGDWRAAGRRLPGAFLCFLPGLTVALVIMVFSHGNHQQMSGHWGEAIAFGASYFLLNPGHLLFGETSLQPVMLCLLAAAKLGVLAGALLLARGRGRQLLLLLLAFDLGSAVLMGVGRYHTGFLAAMSSRYQYGSLLATVPSLTLLVDRLIGHWSTPRVRRWLPLALLLLVIGFPLVHWPAELQEFTGWRGTEMRQLIGAPATSDPSVRVPALDFMHIERAKALQRAYHLH